MSREADDALLGELALLALDRSSDGVEAPAEPNEVTRALVRFLGSRSWHSFARSARTLGLEVVGDAIRVVPCRCIDDSFEPVDDRASNCTRDPGELGATVKRLLPG